MFETLRNYTDIMPLLIVLSFLLIAGTVGLWYVRKTTGRPMRDMLAVLGAGLTLILLMLPAIVFFRAWLDSPDRHTRRLAEDIFVIAFGIVAVAISWAFNKLAKNRAQRNKAKAQAKKG
jgi:hypothetical protein